MTFLNLIELTILTVLISAIIFFRFGSKFSSTKQNSILSRFIYIVKVFVVLGSILSILSVYQEGLARFLRDLPNNFAGGFGLALWCLWPLIKLGDEIFELVSRKHFMGLKVTLKGVGESFMVSILASVGAVLIPNLFERLFRGVFEFSDHYLFSGSGNFGFLIVPFFSAGSIVGYSVLSFVLQLFFKLKGRLNTFS